MKKYIALFMAVCIVAVGSCAFGEVSLFTSHRTIVDFVGGKPDYNSARFLGVWVHALSDNPATQEDLNLTGSMSFSGGNYAFWDSKNGMRKISGTPHTFGLASTSSVGGELGYEPFTASGDDIVFCLSADGGLNGVNVSWNFPDKSSYNGQGTIPNYRTTQEQLESYVPYVEYISSGTQVTGLRWRVVSPDNTSEAVTLDFASSFIVADIWNTSGNHLYSGGWATIEAGNPVSGEVTFDTPINESDISIIRVAFDYWNNNLENSYQWHFCKPSTPQPYLFENHLFNASLVNGKSDYSNARFDALFFDIQADNITAEASHFTTEGSITIPGGGYSLADDNTGDGIGVTIPAGTDKTFNLRMYRTVAPGDFGLTYQPIDENGTNLQFEGGAENLAGRTLTWTFPTEPSLSGSAAISNFKSTAQQLAEGVPYIELVSADGKLTAVNFKFVTSSDTSTALNLPYRTNVRLRFHKVTPDTTGKHYWSDWMYNTSSGTWTLGKPQDLSNMRGIAIRYWSWENPNKSILYHWYFSVSSAPAALEITTATLPDATLNAPYTATLAANLSGATWSLSSGTLPTGLTLNTSTGAITGTPTAAGTSTFTVKAEKDSQSAEKQLSITVSAIPSITITTTSLNSGTVGTAYSAALTASITGANWSVIRGTLPARLSLNSSTGVISGTPTTAGTSTFTVRAVYGSASDEKQFTLTINSPVPTLRITTTSLPDGRTNSPYSANLTASITGATWSVSSGSLPDGLALTSSTGAISGTPTKAGTYTFTVKAVYGSQSAEKAFTVNIAQGIIGIGSGTSGGCESGLSVCGLLLLAIFLKKR